MKRSILVALGLLVFLTGSVLRATDGDDAAPSPEKIAKWQVKADDYFKSTYDFYKARNYVATKSLKVVKGFLGSSVLSLEIGYFHPGTELKYKPDAVILAFNGYTKGDKLFFKDKSLYFLVDNVQLQAPTYVKYDLSSDGLHETLKFEVSPAFFARLAAGQGSIRGKLAGSEFEITDFDQVVLQEVNRRIANLPIASKTQNALPALSVPGTPTPVVWNSK